MQPAIDYSTLVPALFRKTRERSLRWRESNRLGQYVADVGGYAVGISINEFVEMFDGGTGARSPVEFQFLTGYGLEFDRWTVRPDDPEYAEARKLHDLAASSAVRRADMARELLEHAVA